MIASSSHPRRIRVPHVIDVILVSDPEHIKRIESSGDVDRLHRYDTAALPWWVRLYFSATKFHDEERDLWFLPFEAAANPSYKPRLVYLHQKVSTGYKREDVQRISRLFQTKSHEDFLTHEMVQSLNRRFIIKKNQRY